MRSTVTDDSAPCAVTLRTTRVNPKSCTPVPDTGSVLRMMPRLYTLSNMLTLPPSFVSASTVRRVTTTVWNVASSANDNVAPPAASKTNVPPFASKFPPALSVRPPSQNGGPATNVAPLLIASTSTPRRSFSFTVSPSAITAVFPGPGGRPPTHVAPSSKSPPPVPFDVIVAPGAAS